MNVKYSCMFDKYRKIYNGIQLSSSVTDEGRSMNNIYEVEIDSDDSKSLDLLIDNMCYHDSANDTLYFGYYESTRMSNSIVVFIATHKYENNRIVDIEDIFIEESRII